MDFLKFGIVFVLYLFLISFYYILTPPSIPDTRYDCVLNFERFESPGTDGNGNPLPPEPVCEYPQMINWLFVGLIIFTSIIFFIFLSIEFTKPLTHTQPYRMSFPEAFSKICRDNRRFLKIPPLQYILPHDIRPLEPDGKVTEFAYKNKFDNYRPNYVVMDMMNDYGTRQNGIRGVDPILGWSRETRSIPTRKQMLYPTKMDTVDRALKFENEMNQRGLQAPNTRQIYNTELENRKRALAYTDEDEFV